MFETAIRLLEKINSYGYTAYMVGGYPRDLYLKRPNLKLQPSEKNLNIKITEDQKK